MIFRKFPYSTDWLINNKIFDESIDTIESKFKINRDYDIPYVAGYSKDGKTIYIDKDMPKGFKNRAGKFIETDKYLIWHEAIECSLLDKFNIEYQLCHQVALRSERDAVESSGISWKEYNDFMMKYVKKIGDEQIFIKVCPDLDLRPYLDEHDKKTIERMYTSKYKPLIKSINKSK